MAGSSKACRPEHQEIGHRMPHLNVVWLTAMGHRMTEVYGLAYAGPGSPADTSDCFPDLKDYEPPGEPTGNQSSFEESSGIVALAECRSSKGDWVRILAWLHSVSL
jgi:hypothetical protein